MNRAERRKRPLRKRNNTKDKFGKLCKIKGASGSPGVNIKKK